MSVLVALKKGDTIYLGADTQTSFGGLFVNNIKKPNLKIHKYKNGLLLGYTGSVPTSFNVYSQKELFEKVDGELTKEYIVKSIVPKIIERLAKKQMIDLKSKTMESCFIIAYKDKAFKIYDDFKVMEGDALVIGCGKDSAFPYLLARETDDPNEIIMKALKSSASVKSFVSGPFLTINSRDLTFNFYKEKCE